MFRKPNGAARIHELVPGRPLERMIGDRHEHSRSDPLEVGPQALAQRGRLSPGPDAARAHVSFIRRFFGDLVITPFAQGRASDSYLAPRIDVSECEWEYCLSVELPGVDEKDVEVTLTNRVLTIRGEKKFEAEENKGHYLRSERSYGAFKRSFSLPSDIDEGKVQASFKKGVLAVTVAKSATAKSAIKRIDINMAA